MKEKEPEVFTDYEIKPLTLSQREECMNGAMVTDTMFTQVLKWIRFGLTKLKGVAITEDNFEEEVNKLGDLELYDIAGDIREQTQFPSKKKS